MADKSPIEWTDATWNPIVGCSIVSKGCTKCYAMKVAGARTKHTAKYQGLTEPSKGGPVWTGEVRFWEKALHDPLKWKHPRRVFVNSMGDLFHEGAPDEWIDRCFAVMAICPQHTFQILTKRPGRMREYLDADDRAELIGVALGDMLDGDWIWDEGKKHRDTIDGLISLAHGMAPDDVSFAREDFLPLPNVWLGVSCEDQATADQRIPILLEAPAAKRFISAEPLLGPINLRSGVTQVHHHPDNDLSTSESREALGQIVRAAAKRIGAVQLDWVIVGGESGPRARPFDLAWARSIVAQCALAGVYCFVKQLGAKPITDHRTRPAGENSFVLLKDKKGGDWSEWPEDLRVRQFPEAA